MVFQTVIGGYRSLELVSWANGTYSQIAAMLDAHYEGRINITNFWNVGDSRTITLDAIPANDSTGAMAAQTAQLVLLNAGGKTLVTAEHGVSTCAFVIGFKNCLSGKGKFNPSYSNYINSYMRQFLNNELYIALPSDLKTITKAFINSTTNADYSNVKSLVDTEDLVSLAGATEVFGYPNDASSLAGEGSQFTYYTTPANRIKSIAGSASAWWTRSSYNSVRDALVLSNNSLTYGDPADPQGIAPILVI